MHDLPALLPCLPRRRPTFLPAMRLKRQDAAAFMAHPLRRSLAALLAALADLSQPKQALRVLEDEPRLQVGPHLVHQREHGALGLPPHCATPASPGRSALPCPACRRTGLAWPPHCAAWARPTRTCWCSAAAAACCRCWRPRRGRAA
jgi:hypothetical protein